MGEAFATPIGRMVQGDIYNPQTTNKEGQPLKCKDGSPRVQYYVGLAIPKGPEFDAWWNGKVVPQAQASSGPARCALPNFAWKKLDGDAPENVGKEGFPGNWIIRMTNGFPPSVYDQNQVPNAQPGFIKRGYYVKAIVDVNDNKSTGNPGIFINISGVQLKAYGPEINSIDCAAILGASEDGALPPGASMTPVDGSAQAPPVQQQAAPPASPPPPTPPPVVPAPDILNPPVMTAKAAGMTYAQFKQTDPPWTDEQMIAQGFMEPR